MKLEPQEARELDIDINRATKPWQSIKQQIKTADNTLVIASSIVLATILILSITSILIIGVLLRERALFNLKVQTCESISKNSPIDQGKLEFLAKNCIGK